MGSCQIIIFWSLGYRSLSILSIKLLIKDGKF